MGKLRKSQSDLDKSFLCVCLFWYFPYEFELSPFFRLPLIFFYYSSIFRSYSISSYFVSHFFHPVFVFAFYYQASHCLLTLLYYSLSLTYVLIFTGIMFLSHNHYNCYLQRYDLSLIIFSPLILLPFLFLTLSITL